MCNVDFVEVGGDVVCRDDFFGFQVFLEEMEEQVVVVKEWVRKFSFVFINIEMFSLLEDIDRWINNLLFSE